MSFQDDYQRAYNEKFDKAKEKTRILRCQYDKKQKSPACDDCKDRFDCFTMKACKFEVIQYEDRWTTYELFAENREEAHDIYCDFDCESELVKMVDEGGEISEVDMKECDK